MTDIQYFELKKNFWIARWLKKPKKKDILASQKDIKENSRVITIGVSSSIIDKIIIEHKKKLLHTRGIHKIQNSDFDDVSTRLELPKALILLVLERKGFIAPKEKGDKK